MTDSCSRSVFQQLPYTAAALAVLMLSGPAAAVEVACTAGFAGTFPCKDVNLMGMLPNNTLAGGGTGADIWGWTDETTGKEYAVMSHSLTTSFTDITDPANPTYLGYLQGPAVNALWRDVKVYKDHAYVVGDFGPVEDHGLQIFDLTQLRGQTGLPPVQFPQTNVYYGVPGNMFGENHNMWINEDSGYGYLLAGDSCGGGMHVVNLEPDPANPVFVSCIDTATATGGALVVHDAECVNYHGPDPDHQGAEICFNANEDELHIIDVTDKLNPVVLGRHTYAGQSYIHQGTLTDNHQYFLSNDELDEQDALTAGNPHNTHTYLWDVRDLDNAIQMPTHVGVNAAIDHNMYVRGQYLFQSNYAAGLRILDISDIANANLQEIAYFDTHPADDATAYSGTWSNYAFFDSGTVIVSNLEDGVFILKPTNFAADADGDYFADANDNCPLVANDQTDSDTDGVGDACDNCTAAANATQCDSNGDGYGNVCDADFDNSNFVNFDDLGALRPIFFSNLGDLDYNPDMDMDCNDTINLDDLGYVRNLFFAAPGPSALAP